MVKSCWNPSAEGDSGGRVDGLLWCKDLGQHMYGEFSMAVIQANSMLEDQSQIESGPLSSTTSGPYGTFIGVYDGHGGTEASRYVNDNLFSNLKCDSRVVLGRSGRGTKQAKAMQLSVEHNASIETVREELRSLHPNDPHIVVMKHRVWRVKGLIQISRCIGDAYLKKAEFNKEPLLPKFRLPEPFQKPILSAEPSVLVHKLQPDDQFLIFASDGLWEHISNQEAVKIVQTSPRNGIARRLIKAALKEAAKKREMRYSDLRKIDRGVRRHFHDDITVVVVFIDPNLINGGSSSYFPLSIKGGRLAAGAGVP
ncbi:probable protein phosphatase 2C 38 isoform X2 [Gossypium arboreum]|uniref:probable protein phosphatase 2C 38 isoform X2 n=1 Tax=Gossypium arboreum TaxID=29729 RepID=UPI0022F1941C|nr:probable protein phosphatase 2C 38 isoform X2 [Gossypium arboreum]